MEEGHVEGMSLCFVLFFLTHLITSLSTQVNDIHSPIKQATTKIS